MTAATGIAVSRVNNYLHGKYRTIRPDHLGVLAKGVARTPTVRLELVRAYLLDLLQEDMQAEVRIWAAGRAGRTAGKELPPQQLSRRVEAVSGARKVTTPFGRQTSSAWVSSVASKREPLRMLGHRGI